ncbi:MAG: 4Fe-4S binding protein [Chloroflexi bacterium]|nr:4Fe-4S binding protein [Chloroflexota bacterium]
MEPAQKVTVIAERCKDCGFCIEFCPQQTMIRTGQTNSHGYHIACLDDSDKCNSCGICAMICPEFAVIVASRVETKKRR